MCLWESLRVEMGTFMEPGSGFLSFGVGIALLGLSIALIRRGWGVREKQKAHSPRALLALATLFIYSLVLDGLGFVIATFFLVAILFQLGQSRRWWWLIGMSAMVTFLAYLIFATFLGVYFPEGVLGHIGENLETIQSLFYGFSICLTPANLLYCFTGVVMGTLVGVLPGLGPSATISLLLPAIFHAPAVSSMIMLAGICYGAQYGGSTTSILLNIPGEASSVITCLDGYQMAKRGRAGPALGIAAFGSFIAGTIGVIGLMLFAPTLARFALRFGPPEFFSLALMSLTLVTYVSKGSLVRSLIMVCVGLLMSLVGMDPITSRSRFTFGIGRCSMALNSSTSPWVFSG